MHPAQDRESLSGRANWTLVAGTTSDSLTFAIFPGIRLLKMVSKNRSTSGKGINTESPAQVASAYMRQSNVVPFSVFTHSVPFVRFTAIPMKVISHQ